MPDFSPWKRAPLTIPPATGRQWLQLAAWEMWMGMLLCFVLGLGVSLIASSPDHIVAFSDLSRCYGPPPVPMPCERIAYRSGLLNAAFTSLFGVMLIGAAAWFLWELWRAVEPKPITDDFLRLLNDSFGRDWRNPLTWPWARVFWAYGFTTLGAALTLGSGWLALTLLTSPAMKRPPEVHVESSETFRVAP